MLIAIYNAQGNVPVLAARAGEEVAGGPLEVHRNPPRYHASDEPRYRAME